MLMKSKTKTVGFHLLLNWFCFQCLCLIHLEEILEYHLHANCGRLSPWTHWPHVTRSNLPIFPERDFHFSLLVFYIMSILSRHTHFWILFIYLFIKAFADNNISLVLTHRKSLLSRTHRNFTQVPKHLSHYWTSYDYTGNYRSL